MSLNVYSIRTLDLNVPWNDCENSLSRWSFRGTFRFSSSQSDYYTPVLDLRSAKESQELTTGLHEPRPVAEANSPRYKTIGFLSSRATRKQDGEKPPVAGAAYRFELPFSTSKFDVGQINTLRPATFEVVRVDSGRPVNIGAIVPQRVVVVGTFWALGTGGGFPSPRCPLCAADDFWTFLSFVKIGIILRAFHLRASRRLKGRYYRHSFAHPFVHSSTVVSLFTVPSLFITRTCHSDRYPAKNRRIIQSAIHVNANNLRSLLERIE